jgi:hypothetical protein
MMFPPIIPLEMLRRDCGCGVVTGMRLDTREAALVATPCPAHREKVEAILAGYRAALDVPAPDPRYEGRAVMDIFDQLLREAGI